MGNKDCNGTDDYGFSALPDGYFNGNFSKVCHYGYWWTATEYDSNFAHARNMHYDLDNVTNNNYFKSFGLSVRCIADTP